MARLMLQAKGCPESGSEESPFQIWFDPEKPEAHWPFVIVRIDEFEFGNATLPMYEISLAVNAKDAEQWTLKTAVGWKHFGPNMQKLQYFCILAEGPALGVFHREERDTWAEAAEEHDLDKDRCLGPEYKVCYPESIRKFDELHTALETDAKRQRVHFIILLPVEDGKELRNTVFSNPNPTELNRIIVDITHTEDVEDDDGEDEEDGPQTNEHYGADVKWRIACGDGTARKTRSKPKPKRAVGGKRNKKKKK